MYFSKEKTSKIKAYSIYFQLNNNRTQVISFVCKHKPIVLECASSASLILNDSCSVTLHFLSKVMRREGFTWFSRKINHRCLQPLFYYLHHRLIKWIQNKYKRFKRSKVKEVQWLR